jgi:hypothetical protein
VAQVQAQVVVQLLAQVRPRVLEQLGQVVQVLKVAMEWEQ